jgi:RNA polymerase sigma factor (sigma-70 family)
MSYNIVDRTQEASRFSFISERDAELLSHARMVAALAKKLSGGIDAEFDDLFNEGFLALMDAYEKFDPSKGFKFITYAWPCIKGKMLRWIRNQCKHTKRSVSLHEAILGTDVLREDILESPDSDPFDFAMKSIIADKIGEMPLQRKTIASILMSGENGVYAAKAIGKSRTTVYTERKKVRDELRAIIE